MIDEKEAFLKAEALVRAIDEKLDEYREAISGADKEALSKLAHEAGAARKNLYQLQAINSASNVLRFGLVFLAVGVALWLVGYKGWILEADPQATGVASGTMGVALAVFSYLSLRTNRVKTQRADRLFDAGMTTFWAAVLICGAAATAFMWSLLIVVLLSVIRHGDLFDLATLVVVGGVVIVMFLFVVGVTYLCRAKTSEELLAPTFFEYMWRSGMIALYIGVALFCVAMQVVIIDCIKDGAIAEAIKEGHTASLVVMAMVFALCGGAIIACVREFLAEIRYLRKPTLENLMET